MKKLFCLFLIALSICACSGTKGNKPENLARHYIDSLAKARLYKLHIVYTSPLYAFACTSSDSAKIIAKAGTAASRTAQVLGYTNTFTPDKGYEALNSISNVDYEKVKAALTASDSIFLRGGVHPRFYMQIIQLKLDHKYMDAVVKETRFFLLDSARTKVIADVYNRNINF